MSYDVSSLTRTIRTKIDPCPTCDCWLWQGSIDPGTGYSKAKMRNRTFLVHRYVYEHFFGDLDPDLTIDHLCDRHRNCVNPAHFEQVPLSENSRRAARRRWDRR